MDVFADCRLIVCTTTILCPTGEEDMNEEELLGEEGEMGDSEGEEVPEDGQEEMEDACMEEEGEMMVDMEDEDQFPDSNFEDGNEFPEVIFLLFPAMFNQPCKL